MSIARTMRQMQQSSRVVHTIPRRTASLLVARGLVRYTVISPAPDEGVAVNLTVLGKSWRATTEAPAPPPELQQPTE